MLGVISYLDQNYDHLKTQCLQSNSLFVDDKFPAKASSLYRKKSSNGNFSFDKLVWKRPTEICAKLAQGQGNEKFKNPEFIIDAITPLKTFQDIIGNRCFINAMAHVAAYGEYINKVAPDDQSFTNEQYAGIFRFRFWLNGQWVEVVVDDLLPCDEKGILQFCYNSKNCNEFFSPLLYKAYAKYI